MPFAPTPPEQQLVTALFNIGDPQKLGIINGDSAVKLLSGAKVPPLVLGEIWAIADSDNNGFLTKKGAAVLIRLLGWAQKGEAVSEDLLNKVGPLPTIDGLPLPKPATPTPSTPTASATRTVPPLSTEDRNKFIRLYLGCGPQNGVLTGDKAKDVFLKSNLPMEKLGLIWNLADTQNRGALDQTDFIIGMFFIQLAMSQPNFVIPAAIPPGLYEQASGGKSPQSIRTHQTGGSSTGPGSPIARQFTGQQSIRAQYTGQTVTTQHTGQGLHSPQLTGPPSRLSMAPSVLSTISTPATSTHGAGDWDISTQEKATADSFFATLDTQKRGFIEGEVAVPFMVKSGLPEPVLAQIWDLADLYKDGRLNQDGFAIALHLINGKLTGKEVPETLPSSLIPPSMRAPAQPQPSSIQQDLWLLGDTPPPSASQPVTFSPPPVVQRAASPPQPVLRQPVFSLERNLLEDDEDSPTTPAGPDHSIQIGNVQNQLNSTNRSLENTKTERQKTEADVTNSAATLAQLETQLAASKAAYETESRILGDLREKLLAQTATITKTRQELITAESDLSAVRQEKNEIQGNMLRDKDEVLDLQRKMKQVADETEIIKKEIEKVKKDARHQKGLLAIGKKQLATAEGEREKAEKELEVAQKELEVITKEVEEAKKTDVDVLAVATALPQSPPLEERAPSIPLSFADAFPDTQVEAIPSPQSTRSTNPFAALTAGAGTPSSATPFSPFATSTAPAPQGEDSAAVDDPFGFATAFAAQPVATPPPIASQIASPAPVATPPIAPRIASPAPVSTPPRIASPDPKPTSSPAPAPVAAVTPVPAPAPSVAAPSSTPVGADTISLDTPITRADEVEEARRFPAIDEPASPEGELPPLREIQQADEDSSDDDSDSENYAEAKANPAANGQPAVQTTPKATTTEPQRTASPTPRAASPMHEATSSATTSAFDDVFGTSNSPSLVERPSPADSPTPSGTVDPGQSVSVPETTQAAAPALFSTITPAEPPKTATVTDFDEAFGSLAAKPDSGAPPAQATFSFDDAFGDTFDFGDPSVPAIPVTTAPDKTTTTKTTGPPGLSLFDEAFKPTEPSTSQTAGKTSFDDAFGIKPATEAPAAPSLAFDSAFDVPKPNGAEAAATNGPSSATAPKPADAPSSPPVVFPTPKPPAPASPVPSAQPKQGRAASPAPSGNAPSLSLSVGSPPKRSESPSLFKRNAPRKNSNAYAPPPGPPPSSPPAEELAPVKHSKFHFPGFGRSKTVKKEKEKEKNKAEKNPPPPPARHGASSTVSSYSSSILNSTAASGPGEDVEGVRAITAMGFSRDQAVTALEKHGYDVNRALNELLGEGTA
ncbi:hypothetical protein FS837_005282 [Tulasnella sp. UAMH 9824]|nr:hypothetical protein FS837_005282 [Tulasnella sp. UAMH 9824]